MDTREWILLLVPTLFGGVVVFVLQKIFEKKKTIKTEKHKYISVLQQNVDNALALFTKVKQTHSDDSVQINWLEKFVNSYCEVYYYYLQNHILFKNLENRMNELVATHQDIQGNLLRIKNNENDLEARINMESQFCKICELLESIQSDCIQWKI